MILVDWQNLDIPLFDPTCLDLRGVSVQPPRVIAMASLFECEVRYVIKDINALEKKLSELGAIVMYPYEFTDYYFKPAREQWDPLEKNLRIRGWRTPENLTTIFFVKIEIFSFGDLQFKRALYPEGKVPLYSGSVDICRSLLDDLGFESWFEIHKTKAKLWKIPDHGFITAVEYIEGLGWTGELEFEGEDPEEAGRNIKKALGALEIQDDLVSFKPISVIFAEKTGIL